MSSYQDGHYQGYKDAIEGSRNIVSGGWIHELLNLMDDENQEEWREGYSDGYEEGEKEREENE
jgi:hypothetical protein